MINNSAVTAKAPVIISDLYPYAEVGVEYTDTVKAVDTNNDTLVFSLTQAPAGMAIDSYGGTITWNPTEANSSIDVTVKISNSSTSVLRRYNLTVSQAVVAAVKNINASAGDTIIVNDGQSLLNGLQVAIGKNLLKTTTDVNVKSVVNPPYVPSGITMINIGIDPGNINAGTVVIDMAIATILTLVVIPVLYSLLDKLRCKKAYGNL